MKTYALIAAVLLLAGLWPPILTPLSLIATGMAVVVTTLPIWFLALAVGAAVAHRHLTRPRARVIRGHATRKA